MQKFVSMHMLDISSPLGGDVEEIGHFQKEELTFTLDHFFCYRRLGAMLKKVAIFYYVHMASFFGITLRVVSFLKMIVPMQKCVTVHDSQT